MLALVATVRQLNLAHYVHRACSVLISMLLCISVVAGSLAYGDDVDNDGSDINMKVYQAKVLETMDAGGYSYIRYNEEETDHWIVGLQTKLKVGDVVEFAEPSEMLNFESKILKRSFDKIDFVRILRVDKGQAEGEDDAVEAKVVRKQFAYGKVTVNTTSHYSLDTPDDANNLYIALFEIDIQKEDVIQHEQLGFSSYDVFDDVEMLQVGQELEPIIVVKYHIRGVSRSPLRNYVFYFDKFDHKYKKIHIQGIRKTIGDKQKVLVFDVDFMASGAAHSEEISIPKYLEFSHGKFIDALDGNIADLRNEGLEFITEYEKDQSDRSLYGYMICKYILGESKEGWSKFQAIYKKKDKKIKAKAMLQDILEFLRSYDHFLPVVED